VFYGKFLKAKVLHLHPNQPFLCFVPSKNITFSPSLLGAFAFSLAVPAHEEKPYKNQVSFYMFRHAFVL
jgi:hypothetical protein